MVGVPIDVAVAEHPLRGLIGRRGRPAGRFIVFGSGRSGTTVLGDLLDAHPIHFGGELRDLELARVLTDRGFTRFLALD